MFGLFCKKQDRQATVNSTEFVLTVKAGENLLGAGLQAGLPWPHDCRVGSCGTCRCILKKGKIKRTSDYTYVLTGEQLDAGMILACQAELKSDIEVEVELDEAAPAISTRTFPGKISRITNLTHDIVEMVINCEGLEHAGKAGQYAEIAIPNIKVPRSYSFAKAPSNEALNELSFYVRKVPGGEFTEWLFANDRSQSSVEVSLPYGAFYRRDEKTPMICIAGGSGMSAIKAVLEQAAIDKVERDALYLFGARTQEDLYCLDEMQEIKGSWNKDFNFEYASVLNLEPEDSDWQGPRGFVTEYLKEAYIEKSIFDMKNCQGYLCGPPPMIDAAVEMLKGEGMSDNQIFFDKFLDASSMPKGRG